MSVPVWRTAARVVVLLALASPAMAADAAQTSAQARNAEIDRICHREEEEVSAHH